MGFCPNCGSYVSPGSNICSCGTTVGSSYSTRDENPRETPKLTQKQRLKREYSKLAGKYFDSRDYVSAIKYYDLILDIYPDNHFASYGKAKAHYYIGEYEDALEYFKKSIISGSNIDNYPVYEWIGHTLNCLERFDEAIWHYQKAIDLINERCEDSVNFFKSERYLGYEAIERACADSIKKRDERLSYMYDDMAYSHMLKGDFTGSKDDYKTSLEYVERSLKLKFNSETRDLKEEIEDRLNGSKKSKDSVKTQSGCNDYQLNNILSNGYLITITGLQFNGNVNLKPGMRFKLKREPENPYDSDAIALYLEDKRIGYVANSSQTVWDLAMSASDMKYLDYEYAEYVKCYKGMYHIAKLVK